MEKIEAQFRHNPAVDFLSSVLAELKFFSCRPGVFMVAQLVMRVSPLALRQHYSASGGSTAIPKSQ